MDVLVSNWFSTQIISVDASSVLQCAKQKFESVDFGPYTVDNYKNGVTTYFSNSSEFANDVDLLPLHKLIQDVVAPVARMQGVNMDKFGVEVTEMWLNRMGKGAAHGAHVHPSGHYSGTLYVNADDTAAPIRFYNPVAKLWRFCPLPVSQDDNEVTCEFVTHMPTEGKMLLWNSWLEHEVLENHSTDFRDSISFNVRLVPV